MRREDEEELNRIDSRSYLQLTRNEVVWLITKLREVDKALLDLEGLTVQWHTDNPEKGAMLDKLVAADELAAKRLDALEQLLSIIEFARKGLTAADNETWARISAMVADDREGYCSCGSLAQKHTKLCAECAAAKAEYLCEK